VGAEGGAVSVPSPAYRARSASSGLAPQPWLGALAGRFIVFDGPDGSGKSTQFTRIMRMAREAGLAITEVRDPGGTRIGERIRDVLLDPDHEEMDMRCELMLYMASRAQLVAERIRPALQRGELVLADRFLSSTLAYQGSAGGIPADEILAVARAALGRPEDPGSTWPDLVVVFDVDEQTAARRLNPLLDRMERKSAEFHAKVRRGYIDQAEADPEHYAIIDARPDENAVTESMLAMLRGRFAERT